MFYKSRYPNNAEFVPITHTFRKPCRVKIREADGTTILIGYGIGDQIDVLMPNIIYPVAGDERMEEIPLADGSFIVEYPDDIDLE